MGTLHQPGEQVLGLVGAAQRDVLAAFPEDLLNALEEVLVDQGLMRGGVVGALEGHLTEVGAVAEDAEYGAHVEGLSLASSQAALGQPLGER
ncbi:MAG TPA: hypothetical protein VFP21_04520 [Solirubrobacterales bacterium]|nr:hypothetical protein [Solirubrobacterales bacterium]